MRILTLLLFCLPSFAATPMMQAMAQATCCTYFVDSVNGSDSNDGRTPAGAFITLGHIPTLLADQSIGLANGSTWREELVLSANHTAVLAYTPASASVVKPIVSAADLISAGSWSIKGACTNTYQTTTASIPNDATPYTIVYQNGTNLTLGTLSGGCLDAQPGTFARSATSGVISLYVNPTGATNPGSDGNTYEYSVRDSAIRAWNLGSTYYYYIRIDGVQAEKGLGTNGATLSVGDESYVNNCAANNGNEHNLLVGGGSYVYKCTLANSYYTTTTSILLIVYSANGNGKNTTIDSTTVTSAVASPGGQQAYAGHTAGNNFGTITLLNSNACTTGASMSTGVSFGNNAALIVTGGTYDCPIGGTTTGAAPTTISGVTCNAAVGVSCVQLNGNTVTASNLTGTMTGAGYVYRTWGSSGNATWNISGTVPTGVSGAYLLAGASGVALTVNANNLVVPGGYSYWFKFYSAATLSGSGNSFTCNGCGAGANLAVIVTGSTLAWDHNTYTGYGSGNRFTYNGTGYTFANWKTNSGQDANSTYTP